MSDICGSCMPDRPPIGEIVPLMPSREIVDKNGKTLISIDSHFMQGPRALELHAHHELEISCVPSGTGTYRIKDREYDIRPGDVFILPNTDYHGLSLKENERINNVVIHFDSSFIWNSLANDLDYNFLLVFFESGRHFSHRLDRENPATPRIFALMQEILQEFTQQRDGYELMVKIKLQTIFAEIIRNYDYIDREQARHPLPREDVAQLNQVMQYIDNHLDSDIRLAQLAAIAHVSPAYFSTLFKRYNGLSPVEFIVHKRVQRAIELIRTTSMNMTDVAMASGFNNSTNFYKAFRKVTGRTPVSYRRDAQDGRIEK